MKNFKINLFNHFVMGDSGFHLEADRLEKILPNTKETREYLEWVAFHDTSLSFDEKRKQLFKLLDKM